METIIILLGIVFLCTIPVIVIEAYFLQKYAQRQWKSHALKSAIIANLLAVYPIGFLVFILGFHFEMRASHAVWIFFLLALIVKCLVNVIILKKEVTISSVVRATILGHLITFIWMYIVFTNLYSACQPAKCRTLSRKTIIELRGVNKQLSPDK